MCTTRNQHLKEFCKFVDVCYLYQKHNVVNHLYYKRLFWIQKYSRAPLIRSQYHNNPDIPVMRTKTEISPIYIMYPLYPATHKQFFQLPNYIFSLKKIKRIFLCFLASTMDWFSCNRKRKYFNCINLWTWCFKNSTALKGGQICVSLGKKQAQ